MTTLTELQEWRTLAMAREGGFSAKFIAKTVFRTANLDSVTVDQVDAIRYCLTRNKARLKDWRDGLSPKALAHSRLITEKKASRKQHAS